MGNTTIPVSELTKSKNKHHSNNFDTLTVTTTAEQPAKVSTPSSAPVVTPITPSAPKPTTKVVVDRQARAVDQATAKLKTYIEAPIGSQAKTQALKELTHVVCTYPKKPILDLVYSTFMEHRNSEALNPMNALQGLQKFTPNDNWKARTLYQVMMKLTSGDKDIRLGIDTIHNVLGEEFATWVTVKQENLKRRRR